MHRKGKEAPTYYVRAPFINDISGGIIEYELFKQLAPPITGETRSVILRHVPLITDNGHSLSQPVNSIAGNAVIEAHKSD